MDGQRIFVETVADHCLEVDLAFWGNGVVGTPEGAEKVQDVKEKLLGVGLLEILKVDVV